MRLRKSDTAKQFDEIHCPEPFNEAFWSDFGDHHLPDFLLTPLLTALAHDDIVRGQTAVAANLDFRAVVVDRRSHGRLRSDSFKQKPAIHIRVYFGIRFLV